MYYDILPSTTRVTATTNTTVGSTTTTTVIAAPGANNALRIAWISFAYEYNAIAGAILGGRFIGAGFTKEVWEAAVVSTSPNSNIVFPAPGIQLPTNTALSVVTICGASLQTWRATVGYFVDTVT